MVAHRKSVVATGMQFSFQGCSTVLCDCAAQFSSLNLIILAVSSDRFCLAIASKSNIVDDKCQFRERVRLIYF